MTYVPKALLVGCLLVGGCATGAAERADPRVQAMDAHHAWWRAYALGDPASVEAHTSAEAEATFGAGQRSARASLIESARKSSATSGFRMTWSDEAVRFVRPGLAVVTGTSTESVGPSRQVFRITSLLDRVGRDDWILLSTQTTRVAQFAPAVPASVAGVLADYAGRYDTPNGRTLRMEVREDVLWMVEPDGKALKLTPVGPALFEPEGRSPLNGILRFVFARDPEGRVTAFSRLTEGHVDTFPRHR